MKWILTFLFAANLSAADLSVDVQFENDQIKTTKIVMPGNYTVPMHRDAHNRVLVVLKGGKLKLVDQTGNASTLNLETGHSYYLTPDPEGSLHTTTNQSKNSIELIVVEFKD